MRSIVFPAFQPPIKTKTKKACSYHVYLGGCPINPTNQPLRPNPYSLTWKKTSTNPMNILQLLHFNTNLKVPTIYGYTSILRMSPPSLENTHHYPLPSTPLQHTKEILDVKDQVPRFQEELRCPVQLQWIEASGPLIFDSLSNG